MNDVHIGVSGATNGHNAADARALANDEQRRASDPRVSAFVTASAGSGKTKLLTDRLLRLMLAGTPPGRIQCLTFTRAAAAEMAVRLQRRLGEWVTLPDDRLAAQLRALEVVPDEDTVDRARALFADVLDVPGSMRIGTIHAFCQSLLHRFPLEAGLSPQFDLIDEVDARAERDGAREDELARADPAALATLAGALTADQFGQRVGVLAAAAPRLGDRLGIPGPARVAALRRALGARFATEAEVLADAVAWDEGPVRRAAHAMHAKGSAGVAEKGRRVLEWLGLPPALRVEHWAQWRDEFFTAAGAVRGATVFAAKKLADAEPEVVPAMLAEAERIAAADGQAAALRIAAATDRLLSLAAPILDGYARRKRDRGLLDYTDLISRTDQLLRDPGAAWVMFKLDGGIEHLLLDEVQDTAPDQWRIAHTLAAEFFTGAGAVDKHRTFFAVGDPKQSIFSFQGADPTEFERSRDRMRRRVKDAEAEWRDVPLDVSFRSTVPVLDLVDAVFADEAATPGVHAPDAGGMHHVAARVGQAGQVELWPLTPRPEAQAREPWTVPDANGQQVSAPQRLADALARRIRELIGTPLPSRGRALAAGDVLVLVRRRDNFARALVRALKSADVPVAGLDRLDLQAQSAVQDILALCDTLLLPEDDLSLACVLTSPLGGLDDDDLIRLTDGRGRRPLWETLRGRAEEEPRWARCVEMIAGLMNRADHVTPHALLAEILGEAGGRARLLARLGPEAAEPVDELLRSALDYAALHPPSLQGFLQWVRSAGTEVKREAEGAGAAVRVMTSHGAKGLQAPLVILPDTTSLPPDDTSFSWLRDPAGGAEWPVWKPTGEGSCAALDGARAAAEADRIREYNRLLYVALTRAEDRLIVCGCQTSKALDPRCWYRLVEAGFARLDPVRAPFGPEWDGEASSVGAGQAEAPDRVEPAHAGPGEHAPLPAWMGAAPEWRPAAAPAEPALPRLLAPSRPDNARLGPVPAAASPVREAEVAVRRRRGVAVHELLQHLPALPPGDQDAAARARANELGFPDAAAEALSVLGHPALAGLFGPGSRAEQPLSGLVNGVVVNGVVDRLAVTDGEVLLVDYKSGRAAPGDVADTPVLYLRQLAAYRGVLRAAMPGREVRCVLVWTDGATVVPVPGTLLDAYAPGGRAGAAAA